MGWSAVVRVCVLDGRVNEWRGGSGRAGWKGKRTSGRGFRGDGETGKRAAKRNFRRNEGGDGEARRERTSDEFIATGTERGI